MIALVHTLAHALEGHATYKALDSARGESVLNEIWETVSVGFPLYGLSPFYAAALVALSVMLLIVWNLTGKGVGSHAGREEVRRSYRRELARQMARQDAEKIKHGEKTRRKWMQW